jgi:hypothetical protein
MKRYHLAALTVATVCALCLRPAFAETRLAGMSIGQSPRALTQSPAFGTPNGMITQPLTYNPMQPVGMPVAGYPALPTFAKAVAPTALGPGQQEWVYQRGPIAYGFILQGKGNDAQVSDIIISIWNQVSARAPNAKTEKGITLGDSFRNVLLRYDYPALIQTLHVAPSVSQTPAMILPPAGQPAVGSIALPPVPVSGGVNEVTGPVGLGTEMFTRHCILSYPGVTFTLFDMKVVRIHIYEPEVAAPPVVPLPAVAQPGVPQPGVPQPGVAPPGTAAPGWASQPHPGYTDEEWADMHR